MASETSLNGRWVGEYEQSGRPSPIEADLVVAPDGTLSGTMRDIQTDQDLSVFEATASAGLAPGSDEQIEAVLRKLLPDRLSSPIRFVTHLPSDSVLEGRVEGSSVAFVKTYRGESYSGYKVGDAIVGEHSDSHSVHYKGRLSPDGRTLEGKWWIDADPHRGSDRAEGPFILHRQDDDPDAP
jgi:hypothetical protein